MRSTKLRIYTMFTIALFFTLVGASCNNKASVTESSSLLSQAPTGFTEGTVTSSTIRFSWTDFSADESGFDVEQCTGADCTDFSPVADSPLVANSSSYTATGLTPVTVYRFRVRSINTFGASDWLTSDNLTTSAAAVDSVVANSCSAPVTTIVDYGQRATTSTTLAIRGAYSDIALSPLTNYPGVVFRETHTVGAASIKYMYWTGYEFKIETIASGINASYLKLVYLNTSGIPLVFWGNGVSALYGAARSTASTSSEGVWTVAALDTTSTAIRGVDAAVNDNNEVAVFFSIGSNLASGTKAIICTGSCSTMSTTTYPTATVVDAVNTSTNSYKLGVAWCNSGSDYYPMAFYGSSANFRLATCRQADLSTCSGNWGSGIIGAVNANRVATDMYIDQTATNGTVYMAGLGAVGIIPFAMTNCATNAVAATWGATTTGTTFGAATTANAWMKMDRDSAGNFHVVANDAATILRSFSSTTANFVTGAWSASPATNYIETTGAAGLFAGGAGRGSMAVDVTGDSLLVAYGRTAAVTPISTWGNIVIAHNECPSGVGAPACASTTLGSSAASTGMWWGNMPADATGQIQKTSAALPNVSVATTSTGVPAIAYVDYSVSGTADPILGARLKYAYRDGATSASNWEISVIGSGSAPQSPSLAFDSNNLPWISWNETPSATVPLRFFLATNSRTDGSGNWTIYGFPSYYAAGAVTAQPIMPQSALAMYEVSGVKKPLVVTMTSITAAASREVRAALFDPVTRQWQNNKQIATFAGTATVGGAFLSADADSSGNVAIAFADLSTGAGQVNCSSTARCVRFAYSSNGGSTWTATSTSGIVNGAFEAPIVKINPVTSRPALAFLDRANGQVRYKYCNTALSGCTSSTNWVDVGIGIVDAGTGISGLAEATNYGVLSLGMSFTNDGFPWITYPRGSTALTNPNLSFSYIASAAGLFGTPAALYTNPGAGSISTPLAATANNIALSWNPSSARSSETGSLHTAFVGPGNFLYMTSCGD